LLKNPKASLCPVVVKVAPDAVEVKVTIEMVESSVPKNPPETEVASLKVIATWETELRICTFWVAEEDEETVAKNPPATLLPPVLLPHVMVEWDAILLKYAPCTTLRAKVAHFPTPEKVADTSKSYTDPDIVSKSATGPLLDADTVNLFFPPSKCPLYVCPDKRGRDNPSQVKLFANL